MSEPLEVSRRTVLLWTGALAVPWVTSPLRWWRWFTAGGGAGVGEVGARLASLVRDRRAAVELGRAYGVGDRDALIAAVASSASMTAAELASRSSGAMRRVVARAIDADFDADRVVVVDGWLLSRTEASVCALAALTGA